jgi:predicted transcriptional regulator
MKRSVTAKDVMILVEYKLGAMETRFAELIWENEPVSSGELVKLCEKEFAWKKSTTYTMLRRLCQRGIFQNAGGIVSARMSRQEFYALQSEKFVEETFGGSLPRFLAAFTSRKKLTDKEIEELRRLIDEKRGEL